MKISRKKKVSLRPIGLLAFALSLSKAWQVFLNICLPPPSSRSCSWRSCRPRPGVFTLFIDLSFLGVFTCFYPFFVFVHIFIHFWCFYMFLSIFLALLGEPSNRICRKERKEKELKKTLTENTKNVSNVAF